MHPRSGILGVRGDADTGILGIWGRHSPVQMTRFLKEPYVLSGEEEERLLGPQEPCRGRCEVGAAHSPRWQPGGPLPPPPIRTEGFLLQHRHISEEGLNKQVHRGLLPIYKKILKQKLKVKHLLYQHIICLQLRVMTVLKPIISGPKAIPAFRGASDQCRCFLSQDGPRIPKLLREHVRRGLCAHRRAACPRGAPGTRPGLGDRRLPWWTPRCPSFLEQCVLPAHSSEGRR